MAQANIKAVITADDRASKTISGVGTSFGKLTASMAAGQLIANGVTKAFRLLTDTVKSSVGAAFDQVRQVQNSTIALKAYEKNGDKVNKVLKDLIAYARSDLGVLFQREDLFAAAQTLKLYGQTTDTLADKVKILSKGVSLGKTTFQELSSIVGRAAAKGRLDAVDFDMLIERGIGLDKSFRGATVTSEQLFKALDKALPAELLKGRANTIDGLMIKLQSAFRDVGSAILGVNTETSEFIKGGLGDQFLGWIRTLTEYLKSPEFKAAMERIVNWLATNLPLAIAWIRDVGFPALVTAFNTVWPVVEVVLGWIKNFINYMKDNEWVIWALIAVLGTLKTAFMIAETIKAFKTALAGARAAYVLTSTVLSVPITITIAVGAALAALALVRQSAIDTWNEINRTLNAQAGARNAKQDALDRLARIYGDPSVSKARRDVAFKQAQGLLADKSFATGTSFAPGGMALVGERGPEMVSLPRGSQVHRNDETRRMMGGGSTTINITVPMMTGSANERRKVARMLIKDIQDLAAMNGKSATQMLGSNYGLVT